jgi:hypothetical protein
MVVGAMILIAEPEGIGFAAIKEIVFKRNAIVIR